jgi:hypothetical protein
MSEQPKQYPEEEAEAWVEAAAVEDALQEARMAATALAVAGSRQGLTLVHFSAQLERFVWDRGCA